MKIAIYRPVLLLAIVAAIAGAASAQSKPNETRDGSSGLMSYRAIQEALKAGTALEAPSNFFLFFSSHVKSEGHHAM
ncbi:MAG TPA: hypothetical protein VKF84_08465 [Candidatus Sulfotelmatobacter sp.]|nr:hypothetical protein [Candidatus Sulfotelmatobacter sp.]